MGAGRVDLGGFRRQRRRNCGSENGIRLIEQSGAIQSADVQPRDFFFLKICGQRF
jgi:hypothetical protein